MAEKKKYNSILISGRKDQTLTYSKLIKDEESGESVKESLDKKVNKTDQLGTTQLENESVTAEKLANNSVGSKNVRDGSIENRHIENNAVSTSKIASRSVTNEKIAYNSVSMEELTPGVRTSIDKKADAEQVNNSLYDLEKKIGDRVVVEGDVTNLPDEEDLTSVKESERNVLKLADKRYAPENFSGKGYKRLRKNIQKIDLAVTKITVKSAPTKDGEISITINNIDTHISLVNDTNNTPALVAQAISDALVPAHTDYDIEVIENIITLTRKYSGEVTVSSFDVADTGVTFTIDDSIKSVKRNVLRKEMLSQDNTTYEIMYDFDLNGRTVSLPNNCNLLFKSGSLDNGTIRFDDSINLSGNPILRESLRLDANVTNSWNMHLHFNVYLSWFVYPSENIRDSNGRIKFDILYYRFYNMFKNIFHNSNADLTLIIENDDYIVSDNIIIPVGMTADFRNSRIFVNSNLLNGDYVFNLGIDKDVFNIYKGKNDINDKTKYKLGGYSDIKTNIKNFIVDGTYSNLHLILSIVSCKIEDIKCSTNKGTNNVFFYQPKGDYNYSYLDMFEMYNIDLGTTYNIPLDKLTSVYINIGDAKSIEHISGGKWYIENSQRTIIRHAINCVFNIIDSTVGLYNIHNEFNDNIYINHSVVLIQDSYLFLKGNVEDRNKNTLITLDDTSFKENAILSGFSNPILTLINTCIGSENIEEQYKANSRYYIKAINSAKPILKFINSYVIAQALLFDIGNNITKYRSVYLCDKTKYDYSNVVNIYNYNGYSYNFNLNNGDILYYAIVAKHYKRNTTYGVQKSNITIKNGTGLVFGWTASNKNLMDFDIYLSFDGNTYTKYIKFDNVVGEVGHNYTYIPFNADYILGNEVKDINISFVDFDNKFNTTYPNNSSCASYFYIGNTNTVIYNCDSEKSFAHLTSNCEKQDIIKFGGKDFKFNYSIGRFVSTDKTTGTSSERPNLTNLDEGFEYYDSTLKKKIFWNGSTWANLDGTELS